MDTQRAYINGFVKRAAAYGYSPEQAYALLKAAGATESPTTLGMSPGALTADQAGKGPVHDVMPDPGVGISAISPEMAKKLRIPIPPAQQQITPSAQTINPEHMNDLGRFTR